MLANSERVGAKVCTLALLPSTLCLRRYTLVHLAFASLLQLQHGVPAERTKNFSGAEIEGLVKSAASFALNRQVDVNDLSKKVDEDNIKVVQHPCMLTHCSSLKTSRAKPFDWLIADHKHSSTSVVQGPLADLNKAYSFAGSLVPGVSLWHVNTATSVYA